MALTSGNVRVAVTGAVYVAPLATAAPTTAVSVLNAAFKDLGYLNEDGITETRERSTENLIAWQNSATVRTAVTEATMSYAFAPIETNLAVLETFYGTTVTAGALTVSPAGTGGRKAWVFDVIDGANIERTYIAEGEVTEVDERTLNSSEAIPYPMVVTAYTNPQKWITPSPT